MDQLWHTSLSDVGDEYRALNIRSSARSVPSGTGRSHCVPVEKSHISDN